MCSQSRIVNLASIIGKNTAETDVLCWGKRPFSSFDIDAPLGVHLSESAQNLAVSASVEFLLERKEFLLSIWFGCHVYPS